MPHPCHAELYSTCTRGICMAVAKKDLGRWAALLQDRVPYLPYEGNMGNMRMVCGGCGRLLIITALVLSVACQARGAPPPPPHLHPTIAGRDDCHSPGFVVWPCLWLANCAIFMHKAPTGPVWWAKHCQAGPCVPTPSGASPEPRGVPQLPTRIAPTYGRDDHHSPGFLVLPCLCTYDAC